MNFNNNQELSIFLGTWNVAGNDLYKDFPSIIEWLYPFSNIRSKDSTPDPPDIYIISFQEIVPLDATHIIFKSNSNRVDGWKNIVQDNINIIARSKKNYNAYLDDYIIIKTMELVGILMFVIVKKKHYSNIKNISFLTIKTGSMGYLGNKGSVIYRFELNGKSFAFSSGHYAAGQNEYKNRINELNDVLNSDIASIEHSASTKNNTNINININNDKKKFRNHDYWFILGDLNFRIDLDNEIVRSLIKKQEYKELIIYDQLSRLIIEDKNYYCIQEKEIMFPPTYKYAVNSNNYETKKNRVPSWCDRVIFKKNADIYAKYYDSVNGIDSSDHKPVYMYCKININANQDILFNRHNNTECIKRDTFINKPYNKTLVTSKNNKNHIEDTHSNLLKVNSNEKSISLFDNNSNKDTSPCKKDNQQEISLFKNTNIDLNIDPKLKEKYSLIKKQNNNTNHTNTYYNSSNKTKKDNSKIKFEEGHINKFITDSLCFLNVNNDNIYTHSASPKTKDNNLNTIKNESIKISSKSSTKKRTIDLLNEVFN